MTKHLTSTRKDWLAARLELLKEEKTSRGAATRWRSGDKSWRGGMSVLLVDRRRV